MRETEDCDGMVGSLASLDVGKVKVLHKNDGGNGDSGFKEEGLTFCLRNQIHNYNFQTAICEFRQEQTIVISIHLKI